MVSTLLKFTVKRMIKVPHFDTAKNISSSLMYDAPDLPGKSGAMLPQGTWGTVPEHGHGHCDHCGGTVPCCI